MAESTNVLYYVVSNIPAAFRSADLRNYFSQFVESGGFFCFHYRHRPEVLKDPAESGRIKDPEQAPLDPTAVPQEEVHAEDGTSESSENRRRLAASKDEKTCCCVVSVHAGEADRFVKMYAGNQWVDSKGNWLARRCVIRRVKVSDETVTDRFPYRTKAELKRRGAGLTERFTEMDLRGLPELNPPALMPSGNVGTAVTVFLQLIQACRLPPRLIRQLGLTFPKTGSCRRYGNVPFLYQDTRTVRPAEESVYTAGGDEISSPSGGAVPPVSTSSCSGTDPQEENAPSVAPETAWPEGEESESGPDDDDDGCEEWERHEALHEDVTSQERSKERLYEEEVELKWEKGGSGLVFYTDAQYWQEEEGDFDEQTADDWDVDMSAYYDKDGGDMDARDYVQMRREKRRREGLDEGSVQQPIGRFERFTKGMGRRLMERQGWREGDGLGQSQAGRPEALESEGQHPRCKRGFGYHGEKLNSFLPVKKPRPHFLISTVYDKPKAMDQGDTLLRRQPTTSMKYRTQPHR
ncbi:hypothetical protein SKAU_G00330950 [Synaphobranchus kaupii]|uniref:G-patch domain-containing protein n=1 Tax=Synaphobranchus kaupii TaxID=118154 RepID=A0A9Q1EL10_SYNKA|nr:hypothetical protein SKAU_G00330950 [Synaphobranchus kaupii]